MDLQLRFRGRVHVMTICEVAEVRANVHDPAGMSAKQTWRFNVAAALLLLAATGALVALARSEIVYSGTLDDGEFYFTRLMYDDARGAGSGRRGAAFTDWPDAEVHLLQGLSRLTRLTTGAEGVTIDLTDDELMAFPWIYAVEVGRWYLSDEDAARLREYLLRGGFLMVDDFWGTYQWAVFIESMQRVFPDRPIIELEDDHELLHVLYDLDQRIQIPGRSYFSSGVTWQQDGYVPYWRGIFDDDGRLMVAINFNMDMGDAWEHADDPYYPEPMTALAYRFAVNYVIYAMTH
jgi:hypothetical protein